MSGRGPVGTYLNCSPANDDPHDWGAEDVDPNQVQKSVVELLDGPWIKSPKIGTRSDIDFVARAKMIEDIGAPPMKVVNWREIERLGRIPRSNEGIAVTIPKAVNEVHERYKDTPRPFDCYDKNQAPFGGEFPPEWSWPLFDTRTGGMPRTRIVMVSHRWLRGESNLPDDKDNSKAKYLVEYAKKWAEGILQFETYFWIDFACINQDIPNRKLSGIYALPLYISACSGGMVVLANEEYDDRGWCRLEQVVYCSVSEKPFFNVLPSPTQIKDTWSKDGYNYVKKLKDPRTGNVTDPSDIKAIGELVTLAQRYWGQCWARNSFNPRGLANLDKLEFGVTEAHCGSNH